MLLAPHLDGAVGVQTPLYRSHLERGARVVDFAGWQMPVQFTGIIEEHRHTRRAASLFDCCHMPEFHVRGPDAAQALARALACRVGDLSVGRCRYGFALNEQGGVFDDLVCCRLADDEYMIVANAGRREVDAAALSERLGGRADFEDVSDRTAKIDIQGPKSFDALRARCPALPHDLPYYVCCRAAVAGVEALVSRAGYTGELGYEVYVSSEDAGHVWEALLQVSDVRPAGLGARDTLRLEMGYPLYGHELSDEITPPEAGLDWALPHGTDYVGGEALALREPTRRLAGVRLEARRAARQGDALTADGVAVGAVTSGSFAPSLGCAVALGYVELPHGDEGEPLAANVRGRPVSGRACALPFYRDGTVRVNLEGSAAGPPGRDLETERP